MGFYNLPTLLSFVWNGQQTAVTKDTENPENSRPLPVELVSTSGEFDNPGVISPTLVNVTILTANTELSYTFPDDTKRYTIQLRKPGKLKISYEPAMTSTIYQTLYYGSCYEEASLATESVTVYFQSSVSGQTLEILSWG